MRNTFIDKLVEQAEKDEDIVLLTGDLGTGCLEKFIEKFPDRFFNCGIAEQNMIGVAAGLAMNGKKVFIYSICNFVAERAIEFLRDLVCYQNLDVKYVGVGAGFEYGTLGVTHHATDELGGLRALANMTIYSPANTFECAKAMDKMFKTKGPAYLRLNKKGGENTKDIRCSSITGITECYAGKKFAILATGSILSEAVLAHDELAKFGINIGVYSVPQIKPINKSLIELLANNYENIITLEEHSIIGGLGSAVCEILAGLKTNATVTRFGIVDEFTCKVGKQADLRKIYHIDADSLITHIKGRL